MYFLYILKSLKDNKYYTGLTSNLKRRINEHNSRQVKSTKNRAPFELIYTEEYNTLCEVRKREKWFKSGEGREIRRAILEKNIPR